MSAADFWAWFVAAKDRLETIRHEADDALLDEVLVHLHRYCKHLWFELGGHPQGPMEFVISAEGDENYFAQVEALAAAAPAIEGWRIVAFKPPQGFAFVTSYQGLELDPGQCWFQPLYSAEEPGRLALRVGVPDFDPDKQKEIRTGLYIVVETGLGELVSGQRIAFIEACELPDDPAQRGLIPLSELGELVAEHSRRHDA